MANYNISRLSEDIRREISVAIKDIKDKAVAGGIVSVSHCELTNDLSYCKVYISCLDGNKTESAVAALTKASGFFNRRINERIKMRKLPKLIFLADNSQDYYEHISKIIDNLPAYSEDEKENEEE